ncbi:MAG: Na+ dependent nucleoside transporter domain-containing protein [Elusimicrobia bacterium GWA2_56_46]|nr:MAG: Na+ dependent nucleoside transporter domain-containing protein [Elusimicrobia bacterium GWA2_56_46]OGR55365.1 MAG: Na+ dependent nucleoside transporter domain-containing protein [Elusimicrobia bacterium GWC2_56_31]HBB66608.1 NupC/NupG family nucleoside CNT transporter [Elusimicrobiota bacterium]HBW23698.1 NupC/NupG family nucleoside CNT transporter [Elusimicrobiota bacterium]
MERLISFFGMFALLGIAWLFSKNKRSINYKAAAGGLILQVIFGALVMEIPAGQKAFMFINSVIIKLLSFTDEGAKFVFGGLINNQSIGFIFAFQVLPTIIFFSSLMSVLYYLGIMQKIVLFFARIMVKLMNASGAESLVASANIFVGQTEAPLAIRPYMASLTESELFVVMTAGMGTIAGGVMAAYSGMLMPYIPGIGGHLLAASIMSAAGSLVIAKIIIPETGEPKTRGMLKMRLELADKNVIDAAANGATTGLQMALNVGGCLLAFMALLAMLNFMVGHAGALLNYPQLSLEKIFGWLFTPLAWLMGIPMREAAQAGNWIGQKTVLNEFVAYLNMANFLKDNPGVISQRSLIITAHALCGFSNFLSIAIQIGGIGALAPERRPDIARLGMYAVLSGSLACFVSAAITGFLL